MKTTFFLQNELIAGSSFRSPDGTEETYLKIDAGNELTFSRQIESLGEQYLSILGQRGLSEKTLVFSRLFLSDLANQKEIIKKSVLYAALREGALSFVEQAPVENGSAALLSYHIRPPRGELAKTVLFRDNESGMNASRIRGASYDLLWIAGLAGTGPMASFLQTRAIFGEFSAVLAKRGMSVAANALRTWLYVRDIDINYAGMVKARREFFAANELTPETRYLASTGIEGFSQETGSLVTMDAIAMKHIRPEQIERMEVLDHMPPTITYGVTFERGCRIRFGDRSHLHVSGTASIDRNGFTMYPGDPGKQTERAIENVKALLAPYQATINDMSYIAVYLRNPKDSPVIQAVLAREIPPHVPMLFLHSRVCRPNWLVELDGVAIIPDVTEFPHFL
jgi:enamine deaminase RidA (YjgF/YER057c/UK114 family)